MSRARSLVRHPAFWVPSLYLAMGIPFNVINGTAPVMFKSLGISDGQNTVALGSIVVAWSLKPLWAAFLDMYRTKRFFVLGMELLMAVFFVGLAMALPLPSFFRVSIAVLWVAAFLSSTQDICGDGIYLTALDRKAQANAAGFQGMFWNLGRVVATGWLVSGMEWLSNANGWGTVKMWMGVWITAGVAMALFAAYHVWALPTGSVTHRPHSGREVVGDFVETAKTFFQKRAFWGMIAFVFLYRFGEGLLLVEGKLFMQSTTASGGLGLSAGQVANIDAVWGTIANIVGGVLGGMYLGKIGLKRALPFLGLCLNVPHFTFVYLSHYGAAHHGLGYATIVALVSIEKFGYGFGFVGNMVYMMQQLAPGRSTMTHYAFATALMNLMLVPTTMVSGPLAEWLGFSTFFLVVMFASVPSVWAAWRAPFPLDGDADMKPDAAAGDEAQHALVTIDDPSRLSAAERTVQVLAGRASVYAMLNVLMLLVVDSKILGALQGEQAGEGRIPFALLVGSALVKIFLSVRAFQVAAEAVAAATPIGEKAYRGNATGAKIVTLICGAVTLGVLAFAAHVVF